MKNKSVKNAYEQIVAILSQLNIFEAKSVIDDVCTSISQGSFRMQPKTMRRLSNIERDRELHVFILNLDLEHMTQRSVLDHCIEKFGLERSPSKTALNRAFSKLLEQKNKGMQL
ncbi:primosomal protein [Vibrio cholerae]|uniref:primosomal protein n=1 Tax=Vibrio cholerae TaxID=666 RepID=UPI002FDBC056